MNRARPTFLPCLHAVWVLVAATSFGCANGGPRWRREPVGEFNLNRPPTAERERVYITAQGVRVQPVADEGDVLREDWVVEVSIDAKKDSTGLAFSPEKWRLVVEPIELSGPYADGVPRSADEDDLDAEADDEDGAAHEDNDPEFIESEREAEDGSDGAGPEGAGPEGAGPEGAGPEGAGPEVDAATDAPLDADPVTALSSNEDIPLIDSRLAGAVGTATESMLLVASGMATDEGAELASLNVVPDEGADIELTFRDVPSFTVYDAIGRGLLMPSDATLELEAADGELIHIPIARPGVGAPAWMKRGFQLSLQLDVGTSLTVYDSRHNMVAIDLDVGPQFSFGQWFVLAQLFLRMGTEVQPWFPNATDQGDPLLGDIVSMAGGRIAVGYEVIMVEELTMRLSAGWRPAVVKRDSLTGTQGIHSVVGTLEIGFRDWDSTPYFRTRPQSRWGVFVSFSRDLGELSGPEWTNGTALTAGVVLRPTLSR